MDTLLLSCFILFRFLCLAGQSFNPGIVLKLVDSQLPWWVVAGQRVRAAGGLLEGYASRPGLEGGFETHFLEPSKSIVWAQNHVRLMASLDLII